MSRRVDRCDFLNGNRCLRRSIRRERERETMPLKIVDADFELVVLLFLHSLSLAALSHKKKRTPLSSALQLVLVELDELGRPIARHLLPAPAYAPKNGCYCGPAPPPLRVSVGRAGGR